MDFKRRGHGRDAEADTGSSVEKSGCTWTRSAFWSEGERKFSGTWRARAARGWHGLSSPGSSPGLRLCSRKRGNGPGDALPEPQRQRAGAGTSNTGKSRRKLQPTPGSAGTTRPAVKSHCLSRLLNPGANPQLQNRIWPLAFFFFFFPLSLQFS